MVLFGLRGLIHREQARQLLAWSVRRHWGFISLPELAQWQRGKPYFPHLPRCQFNLSHSGTLALCALSDRPVGVDIQMVRPVWRDSLIDRSCTPGERAWLRSRQDRPEEFAALWAAKECLGKQNGSGLPYPPPGWPSLCPCRVPPSTQRRSTSPRGGSSASTSAMAGWGPPAAWSSHPRILFGSTQKL